MKRGELRGSSPMRLTLFPGTLCVPNLSGYALIFLRFSTLPCLLGSTRRPGSVLWCVEWGWGFFWGPETGASGTCRRCSSMCSKVLPMPRAIIPRGCSAPVVLRGPGGVSQDFSPCVAQELPSAGTKSKLSFSKFSSS